MDFQTKDSGKREEFASGMVRDVQDDKPRYDLVYKPLYIRWIRYQGPTLPLQLLDVAMQMYLGGDTSADHAAALLQGINAFECVKEYGAYVPCLAYHPLYYRWAMLMMRGAKKYGDNNWMKAEGEAELNRFKASAERHLQQYLRGDTDEDHGAAVCFNLAGAEYVKTKMATQSQENSNTKVA